jgi:hypothetical protein
MSEDQPAETGILYSEKNLDNMSHRLSRLKPVEPGDVCCNCGGDCDGPGFSIQGFHAFRINGHPLCARNCCYGAHLAEFTGRRDGCRCGVKDGRKSGRQTVKYGT